MTNQDAASAIRAYLRSIEETRSTGLATEHSYRPALKTLVEALGGEGTTALNEPAHVECGAPDFIVEHNGVPIGHIECKDIGASLAHAESTDQLGRYRAGLPNLILTDYLEFRWYADGELRGSERIGSLGGHGGVIFDSAGARQVDALVDAFFTATTPSVGTPRNLAKRTAAKARLLRDGVNRILAQEGESGPLHDLLNAYREVLISDLSPFDFADMQAQTAAYGLFAARCRHEPGSGPFTRQSAVFAETTPFLRDVFGRIAGPGIDQRIAWIVDDLATLLDRADMEAILTDFGSRTVEEDPVVHFYEDFLAAYDPELREMRGVYYTPEPVVSYIVRSVDLLLRDRFDLADGLANTDVVDFEAADGTLAESPRVLILDPAAGTGTFLREVVTSIRAAIEGKGLAGAWPDYVRDHLLPRLFGFELLMAPYAICHLKLALEIAGAEAGFAIPGGERLNVFLTNTLEEAHEATGGPLFAHEIAREATSADAVKRDRPVMVVLGNPPYSGHSANKGPWIRDLLRGTDGVEATGSYFHADGEPLRERNPKWLNDDYVKFIRFAQWRIERTGEGVLGFVTNHSYLDNPTFRGMRQSLMETFDEIYLLDLHGNSKKKERAPDGGNDENVFDIQQGVAIGLFVKRGEDDQGLLPFLFEEEDSTGVTKDPARVFHADVWGERDKGPDGGKYGWLAANDVESTQWAELTPKSPRYLFIPRDETLAEEYEAGWGMTDVFPTNSVGIVTARDKLAIRWTRDEMRQVASTFAGLSEEDARVRFNLGRDVQDWEVGWAQADVRSHPDADAHVTQVLYRPFDERWTYYTGQSRGFVCRPRSGVMRHMLAGPNVGLCIGRAGQVIGSRIWDLGFVSESPPDFNLFRRGGNCLFPLYTYPTEEQERLGLEREPNLDQGFVEAVGSSLGLDFEPDGPCNLRESFGPEDVFHYIYAVLHSPEYRRRYADFLKSDFPRVPFTGDRTLFAALVELGERLTSLHLMESEGEDAPAFPVTGDNRVEKVRYAPPLDTPPLDGTPGRVFINASQYFEGVTPETWEFTIGGYRPAEKWLKDRRRRTLAYEDIVHYRRICAALAETPGIMARVDETIESHGGWPIG